MNRFGGFVGLVVTLVAGMALGALFFAPGGSRAPGPDDGAGTPAPVTWRLAPAFTSTGAMVGELGRAMVARLAAASGGTIRLEHLEPGTPVPPGEVFEAVSTGRVEAGWATSGYWADREPALVLFSSVPFGPTMPEYLAWLEAGGRALFEEVYARHDIHPIHCGMETTQGSGWFRAPITTAEDLAGLRIRYFGLGGRVLEKLGATVVRIPGGEIKAALADGTIDGLEFSTPADDLAEGFHELLKHYYLPGWHQPATMFELIVNREHWAALAPSQQALIETVCADMMRAGAARSEAAQAGALAELEAHGVTIERWPPELLAQFRRLSAEVMAEEAARDATFAKVWDSLRSFRESRATWRALAHP